MNKAFMRRVTYVWLL